MNVQERLISANKLLEWLDDKFRKYPRERMGDYGAGQDAIDMVATAVERGTFDVEPQPLPKSFKCPHCSEVSSEHDWNRATLTEFGFDIVLINDPGNVDAVFTCPKCESESEYTSLDIAKEESQ